MLRRNEAAQAVAALEPARKYDLAFPLAGAGAAVLRLCTRGATPYVRDSLTWCGVETKIGGKWQTLLR